MKLYLCTFKVDYTPYMGRTRKGEKDFRLVWAEDQQQAEEKLLKTFETQPNDDSYWVHDLETHEAIM